MKGSKLIPKILADRYSLFEDLKGAYKLLEDLAAAGTYTTAECEFVLKQIEEIKTKLRGSDPEVKKYLERFRNNNREFVYLNLHFFAGWSVREIADLFGEEQETVQQALYRIFQKRRSG